MLTNQEKAEIYDLFALPQKLRHICRDELDVMEFAEATTKFIEAKMAIRGLHMRRERIKKRETA